MSEITNARHQRQTQRYQISVPVRIRMLGADQEIVCSTRDVSSRGIFVYTDYPLQQDSRIQFTMKLVSSAAPEEGIQMLCSGTVIRVESLDERYTGMAATIDSCRVLYQDRGHS